VSAAQTEILTIGHSNHSFDRFLELLREHGVTAIADVRSAPYSKFAAWSAKHALAKQLPLHGIHYVFLGEELGGRPEGDEFENPAGRGDLYRRIAETRAFQEGLDRVEKGVTQFWLALLCSEEDPAVCHRHNLVTPELQKRGYAVRHVRKDGSLQRAEDIPKPRWARQAAVQATQLDLLS
jgi:uncharacterized protein (DUF488 family)